MVEGPRRGFIILPVSLINWTNYLLLYMHCENPPPSDEVLQKKKKKRNRNGIQTTMMPPLLLPLKLVFRKSSIIIFLGYLDFTLTSIFLHMSHTRVVAYHLSASKVEDPGCLPLDGDDWIKPSVVYSQYWVLALIACNKLFVYVELSSSI